MRGSKRNPVRINRSKGEWLATNIRPEALVPARQNYLRLVTFSGSRLCVPPWLHACRQPSVVRTTSKRDEKWRGWRGGGQQHCLVKLTSQEYRLGRRYSSAMQASSVFVLVVDTVPGTNESDDKLDQDTSQSQRPAALTWKVL